MPFYTRCVPDSVCVVSERLVLPFPEDLRVGNPGDATLQSHRVPLGHTCVLQLLHKQGGLVHLFGCGEEHVSESFLWSSSRQRASSVQQLLFCLCLFTCDDEFQVKGVLAGSVAGDAGVDAGVAAGHGLDDQGVHAVFPHQHLVGRVGADGLSVQLPDEVWGGQAAHLQGPTEHSKR